MKKYYYHISYDSKEDEFWGMIDDNIKSNDALFTIDTTADMCEFIMTGVMDHIDDVDGLAEFLREKGFMNPDDELYLSDKLLF